MSDLRTTAQQALEALEDMLGWQSLAPQTIQEAAKGRAAALKAALAGPEVGGNLPPPLQERNFCSRCGKRTNDIHTCTPPSTEPQCNPHHKAPHGFLRNASHTEDRYVCECEHWDPYEAGYQAGCEAMLKREDQEPAALLTTWVSETEAVTEPLFKAPRRLTDAEIGEVWFAARIPGLNETDARRLIRAAEARSGAR